MAIFKPHPYQQLGIAHIIQNLRCAIWCFMGGGKSVMTLTALEQLSLTEEVYPALIIAPLRVANDTWPTEIRKWAHTKHLKVSVATGDKTERQAALRREADVVVTNFENIPWLVHNADQDWPYKTIIIDESSKLAGFRLKQGAARAKILAKVAFKSPRMIQLTGTPASNGVAKLWGQLWFLDKGVRLGRTFTAFSDRWFKQSFDGFSLEPLPTAQKEIEEKIKDLCLSIRAEDYYPVDDPIKTIVSVKLPPHVLRQYKELEKKMFVDLGQHQLEPLNAAAKTNKCLQFANGAVYVDEERNWHAVHDEKIEALKDLIDEANGAPVLVAYNFVSDLERLKKRFSNAKVLDKNPKTIEAWNRGKIPILLAHPASAGHGINLALGGNILIFYSVNWNLEEHLQIIERLGPARQKQAGLNRSVFIYYIFAENTIDYLVMDRLNSKRSVQDILMEAMKR